MFYQLYPSSSYTYSYSISYSGDPHRYTHINPYTYSNGNAYTTANRRDTSANTGPNRDTNT